MIRLNRRALIASAMLLPLVAQAHPGHENHAGLMQGLLHPLTGWDHLFVLLSLGALAAGRGARFATICGAWLTAALLGGAMTGVAWPVAPLVEPAILATVVGCMAMWTFRRYISGTALVTLCLGFTFVHGMAHGQEAPNGDLTGYFAGFTFSGVMLYTTGALLTQRLLQRRVAV